MRDTKQILSNTFSSAQGVTGNILNRTKGRQGNLGNRHYAYNGEHSGSVQQHWLPCIQNE